MESINKFDNYCYNKVQQLPFGPIVNISTIIGHPVVISSELFILGLSLVRNNYQTIGWSILIQIPLLVSISLIKIAVRRIRPLKHFQAQVLIDTYSFPSGHAYATTVLSGTLIYALSQFGHHELAIATAISMFFVTLVVGITRVYIKAHYMSDVLAGWALGILAVILIYR